MLWIRLIFIIMQDDMDINTIQLLLIHLALREIRKTFSVQKDYNLLIEGALNILSPGGTLLLCTNSSAFSLKAFKNVIKKTLAQNNIVYEINEVMGLPKDFKTHPHYKPSKYLKAVFVTIKH